MSSTLGSWRSAIFHSNDARPVPMVLANTWYGGGAAWQFQSSTWVGKSMGKNVKWPGLQCFFWIFVGSSVSYSLLKTIWIHQNRHLFLGWFWEDELKACWSALSVECSSWCIWENVENRRDGHVWVWVEQMIRWNSATFQWTTSMPKGQNKSE